MFKRIAVALTALGAVAGGYLLFIRPWQLRWGATDEEVQRPMPGDDIVKHPTFHATRAVTIQAQLQEVWPWLVQIGCMRAGWYSYDWIDNLGIPSAQRILPAWQHLEVGDLIPMSPDGKQGFWVKDFEVNRWMLWWDKQGKVTWYWGLYLQEKGQTRFITRVRLQYTWTSPWILFNLLLDVGDIVMMRKCMLGIKQRAEREAAATPRTVPVPYTQSDGLSIYRFGKGEPILFMPYPHAASVVGDPMPTAIIERLEQADRQVITFDPPGADSSTRPARLDLVEMLDSAEEALEHCGVNGLVDVVGHS
jgi:hypothetical protein